jgi:hypothetical protein
LWICHLYLVTFKQHPHMAHISLSVDTWTTQGTHPVICNTFDKALPSNKGDRKTFKVMTLPLWTLDSVPSLLVTTIHCIVDHCLSSYAFFGHCIVCLSFELRILMTPLVSSNLSLW